ncbi:hypothetical protein QOT17_010379 [Balamuthia mandrillaris]
MNDKDKQQEPPKACAPCREAHQACDKGRPCGRCRHLNRTHLCRDPRPPLRKRGRPSKQASAVTASGPLQPSPAPAPLSSVSSPAPRACPKVVTCTIPIHHPPPPSSSIPSSSPASSPSSPAITPEEEPLSAAPYCHRCGAEFVRPEIAFCKECGLRRGLHSTEYHSPPSVGSPPKKRRRSNEATITQQRRQTSNGEESEDSATAASSSGSSSPLTQACSEFDTLALPVDSFSSSFSSPSSCCCCPSSSFAPLPCAPSSSSPLSNKNGIIKLWLTPVITTNTKKPGCSTSIAHHLSPAHMLECFVDNQLTEPWALIRPFVFGSEGSSVVAVNSAFLKISGYTQHELLGRNFRSLIPEELLEATELRISKMRTEWADMHNCQMTSRDPCTIAAKDGTWVMSHALATFYFGAEGGNPLFIAIKMKNAIPVHKSIAIEWSRQADSLEPSSARRVSPRKAVALPRDVRFHEGSFFPAAPVTSLAKVMAEKEAEENFPPASASSLLDPLSTYSTTSFLDLLTSATVDYGSGAWLDAPLPFPASSSCASSIDRYSQQDCCPLVCEPSYFNHAEQPPAYAPFNL